jgi:hypothetical protein
MIAFSGFGVSSNVAFGSSIVFASIALTLGLIGGLLWLVDRREFATLGAIDVQVASSTPMAASERAELPRNR